MIVGEVFVELGDGDDAFLPDLEIHGLVGRMDGVLLQAKAHEDRFAAEDLLKGSNDGNGTAATGCQRTLAKGYLKAFLRRFVCRNIYRADITLTAVHGRYFDTHALRRESLDIIHERL